MPRCSIAVLLSLLLLAAPAAGQSRPDLYQCEGCEAIHERAFEGLSWRAVIPQPGEPGERLVLTGRMVNPDGVTPAPGVVLYVHHTNALGLYPRGPSTV